jgi:hypothetical protein
MREFAYQVAGNLSSVIPDGPAGLSVNRLERYGAPEASEKLENAGLWSISRTSRVAASAPLPYL